MDGQAEQLGTPVPIRSLRRGAGVHDRTITAAHEEEDMAGLLEEEAITIACLLRREAALVGTRRRCARPSSPAGPEGTADLQKLKPERLDLSEHAEERRLVGQHPDEHRLPVAPRLDKVGEGGQERLAELAANADLALQRWFRFVHGASIAREGMSRHPPDGMSRASVCGLPRRPAP